MSEASGFFADVCHSANDLRSEAMSIYNQCQETLSAIAVNAVKRNHEIVCLKHDPRGIDVVSKELLARCATWDATAVCELNAIAVQVQDLHALLTRLRDEQSEVFGVVKISLENMGSQLRSERDRVEELTSRLKEHAINNPETREFVWALTCGRCYYCDVPMTRERTAEEAHRAFCVDHLVAKANGGPDHTSNYVPACHRCNSAKGSKSYIEFKRWLAEKPDLKVVGGTDG